MNNLDVIENKANILRDLERFFAVIWPALRPPKSATPRSPLKRVQIGKNRGMLIVLYAPFHLVRDQSLFPRIGFTTGDSRKSE